MRPPQHAHDSPFGSLRFSRAGHALHFHQHLIAVHRVFDRVARDKHIAIQPGDRRIRHDESVPVVMQHQPALDFVVAPDAAAFASRRGTLSNKRRLRASSLSRCPVPRLAVPAALLPPARKPVASPRQFLDCPPFCELGQHFVEGAPLGLRHV